MRLAINIAAMLLAFVALIAMLNYVIGWIGDWHAGGYQSLNMMLNEGLAASATPVRLNLGLILGYVLAPIAWVIGMPWNDAIVGRRPDRTEGRAQRVHRLPAAGRRRRSARASARSARHSRLILTYALCGFANFASIAIQIGGIGGLAPDRRGDLARFGLRAVLGGSLATLMTATIAGVLLTVNS